MTIPNKIKWLTIAHQMILLLLVEKETHLVRLKPVKPKTLHVLQITQRMSWKSPLRSEIILLYRYEDKYLIFPEWILAFDPRSSFSLVSNSILEPRNMSGDFPLCTCFSVFSTLSSVWSLAMISATPQENLRSRPKDANREYIGKDINDLTEQNWRFRLKFGVFSNRTKDL